MTILFLALWLQMSAHRIPLDCMCGGGFPECSAEICAKYEAGEKIWGNKANGSCLIPSGPLLQVINMPTALDDITRAEFAEAAQRAADETDGKPPLKVCNIGEPNCGPPPVDRVDVPAVQLGGHLGFDGCGQSACSDHWVTDYTCSDKSRVLLTSEDGKKHCIKF